MKTVIVDLALATALNTTSVSAPLRPPLRITTVTTATSETPLPEKLALPSFLQASTQGAAVQRSILSELDVVAQHLSVAGVLPLSEEAQATVDRILARNAPASGKKPLLPRKK